LPPWRRRLFALFQRHKFTVIVFGVFLIALEAVVRWTAVVEREAYGLGNSGTERWFVFETNALGFRETEVSPVKPADEFRVLFIGDSFTFGQGVARDKTFARLLEKRWQHDPLVPGKSVRVINASKMGWNIAEEEAFLLEQGSGWEPDLVLLVTIPNDSEFGATYDHFHDRWATRSLFWRSHLFRFVYVRWLWLSLEHLHPENNVVLHLRNLWEPGSREFSAYREAFRRMAARCRQQGVDFLQVLFPFFYRLDPSHPLHIYHEQASLLASETGTPCLDLLPHYLGKKPIDLSVSATDSHPNERAHALAAEAIDRFVRDTLAGSP